MLLAAERFETDTRLVASKWKANLPLKPERQKLWHGQFNIINIETLLAAQNDPKSTAI